MASRTRRKTEFGNGYRNWNNVEERLLYEYSIKGLTDSEIAQKMDRSVSAIVNRRYVLRERDEWDKIAKEC